MGGVVHSARGKESNQREKKLIQGDLVLSDIALNRFYGDNILYTKIEIARKKTNTEIVKKLKK